LQANFDDTKSLEKEFEMQLNQTHHHFICDQKEKTGQVRCQTKPWRSRLSVVGIAILTLLPCLASLNGCSNPAESQSNGPGKVAPVSTPQQDTQGERPNLIASEMRQKLVGIWLGRASIDQNRLNQVLASVSQDRRTEIEKLVRDFLTTSAAIEFGDSGSFEQEIEIVPQDGEAAVQASGLGRWQALETNRASQQVAVEASMQLTDGSQMVDQLRFQFGASDQEMTQLISLGAELAGCQPAIIFQKQSPALTNLAEGSKEELK
jgi:hypothetical protein